MTSLAILAAPLAATPPPPRLSLRFVPRLQVCTASGQAVQLRARKARALLALVTFATPKPLTRHYAAGLLWSTVERTVALARLRDALHNLQKDFRDAGVDALVLHDSTIALREDAFVHPDNATALSQAGAARFLSELDGLDPAFDRWLTRLRDERHGGGSSARALAPVRPEAARSLGSCGPSVVVTAFDALGTRGEAQFAVGLAEEVASSLTRLRWFTVITRGRNGRRLSRGEADLSKFADYALTAILQTDAADYRLAIKLMDLATCAIVWAATFVQPRNLGFAAQERFSEQIAAGIDTELLGIEANSLGRPSSRHRGEAYSLVLQAIPAIHRLERDPFLAAGHALEQAVAINRDLAMAHSWLAYWHMFFVGQGWARNPAHSMIQAQRAAERAIMLDPKDARGLTVAGHVKAFMGGRLDEATALHELALQQNSAMSMAWHFAGVTHAYSGRLNEAERCILRSRELGSTDPHGFFAEGALGIVRLLQHQHRSAATIGRRVTERHPHFTSAYKSYLAALGHLGERTEARAVLRRLHDLDPNFSLQRFRMTAHYQRTDDLEHFLAGLRLAGLT